MEKKSIIHSTEMLFPYRCAHSAINDYTNYDIPHLEMEGVAFECSSVAVV